MLDNAGIKIAQGENISCEQITGVNDNMAENHYHEFFELYYLESGERYHMIQDELVVMKPGDFIIFPPYVLHRSFGKENIPFKRIVLYFSTNEIISEDMHLELLNEFGFYNCDRKNSFAVHRLLEMMVYEEDTNKVFSKENKKAILNLLLVTILRYSRAEVKFKDTNRINQVIRYIHTNYMDDLKLEDLAKKFFISKYHLARLFKQRTNKTVIQYLNTTRVMNAQRKIMETRKSLTEISNETGFASLTHFSRIFKSETNQTPSEYRRNYLYKNKNTLE